MIFNCRSIAVEFEGNYPYKQQKMVGDTYPRSRTESTRRPTSFFQDRQDGPRTVLDQIRRWPRLGEILSRPV